MIRYAGFAIALFALLPLPAAPASSCDPDGVQASGSIYRICMPPAAEYNGKLVIWAHGFQDAGTPVSIPEDQLCIAGTCLPDVLNGMGFGFATNSYSKTGLAITQGVNDILDLVEVYAARKGRPQKVYLVGASEGGIITALAVERRPDVFSGGLSACGPIGNFPMQINYFGDARVTFDHFFPGLIPGTPFDPHPLLVAQWRDYYDLVVKPAILAPENRSRLDQWAAVARLPSDPGDYLGTVEQSARDALRYSVVNLRDASATLGGFPFDNRDRVYSGSADDALLNRQVLRVAGDAAAFNAMAAYYETSGHLQRPLITMHTTRDQQVPFAHQHIYTWKTLAAGTWWKHHFNVPLERYGHCNFTPDEVLWGFALLLLWDGGLL